MWARQPRVLYPLAALRTGCTRNRNRRAALRPHNSRSPPHPVLPHALATAFSRTTADGSLHSGATASGRRHGLAAGSPRCHGRADRARGWCPTPHSRPRRRSSSNGRRRLRRATTAQPQRAPAPAENSRRTAKRAADKQPTPRENNAADGLCAARKRSRPDGLAAGAPRCHGRADRARGWCPSPHSRPRRRNSSNGRRRLRRATRLSPSGPWRQLKQPSHGHEGSRQAASAAGEQRGRRTVRRAQAL
jgi:hypothetical protein